MIHFFELASTSCGTPMPHSDICSIASAEVPMIKAFAFSTCRVFFAECVPSWGEAGNIVQPTCPNGFWHSFKHWNAKKAWHRWVTAWQLFTFHIFSLLRLYDDSVFPTVAACPCVTLLQFGLIDHQQAYAIIARVMKPGDPWLLFVPEQIISGDLMFATTFDQHLLFCWCPLIKRSLRSWYSWRPCGVGTGRGQWQRLMRHGSGVI